jgi:hypothetical protein
MPARSIAEAANERPTHLVKLERQDGSQGPVCSPVTTHRKGGNAEPGENGWSLLDAHKLNILLAPLV